jgi:hypothetical protein
MVGWLVDIKVSNENSTSTTILRLILLGGELNIVDNVSIEILGSGIHIEPEMQGGKEVTISFASIVARENNHGSVMAAQKAGRKANKASAPKTYMAIRAKGKGRAIEEVRDIEVASKVLGGRKRKAVDIEPIAGPSMPRKLRKRV